MSDGGTEHRRVGVVTTCHNLRETTAQCVRALAAQQSVSQLSLFVTDDAATGSTR